MRVRFVMPVLLAAGLLPWLDTPASAAGLTLDLGGGSYTSQLVQIVALITVLSLAPGILVMVTSFTRIVIVLSFLRSALGLQQGPMDHSELRDGQTVFAATQLEPGLYRYQYLARANTPGSFVAPPARASEMYHPETFGSTGANTFEVSAP